MIGCGSSAQLSGDWLVLSFGFQFIVLALIIFEWHISELPEHVVPGHSLQPNCC